MANIDAYHPQPNSAQSAAWTSAVQELTSEILKGTQAIAENSLELLEASLWRQQVLCITLRSALRTQGPLPEHDLSRDAIRSLLQVSKTFAILIGQAHASNAFLYGLGLSYSHQEPPDTIHSNHSGRPDACMA